MNTRNVHDRLNGIEAFVQAAEAGSFALAAERLPDARPSASPSRGWRPGWACGCSTAPRASKA